MTPEYVPIPCRCDPPRAHGPHWVRPERLIGDLRGKVKVDPVLLELLTARAA